MIQKIGYTDSSIFFAEFRKGRPFAPKKPESLSNQGIPAFFYHISDPLKNSGKALHMTSFELHGGVYISVEGNVDAGVTQNFR